MPTRHQGLRLTVDSDGMSAALTIYTDFPDGKDALQRIHNCLAEREVAVTSEVLEAAKKLLQEHRQYPEMAREMVIARGTPPKHGKHGGIVFLGRFRELGEDRAFRAAAETSETENLPDDVQTENKEEVLEQVDDGPVDYRSQSTLLTVHAGEVVARIIPPEEGCPGVDVRGKKLACKEAKPFELRHDKTIEIRDDGAVVAVESGMLVVQNGRLRVARELFVSNYVDFSTGNIEFAGTLTVNRGIRDGFKVVIDGDLTVFGLIEAAIVETTGNATFKQGMAGRDKGTIAIGRNLEANYLDCVKGSVSGDLVVHREIVNSDLSVGRNLIAPNAAIIGGSIRVAGSVNARCVGSPSQGADLTLACVDSLNPLIFQARQLGKRIEKELEQTREQRQLIENLGKIRDPAQQEELTEISFRIASL
ncbi:MAG TPA: DUF342 domain-containing protein, partial [Phycisphaeraceae bacterium]|nr:DUF342 domain-containing protein [Phycisphaeraceae bacterium]